VPKLPLRFQSTLVLETDELELELEELLEDDEFEDVLEEEPLSLEEDPPPQAATTAARQATDKIFIFTASLQCFTS
jgi:hypothetical protein